MPYIVMLQNLLNAILTGVFTPEESISIARLLIGSLFAGVVGWVRALRVHKDDGRIVGWQLVGEIGVSFAAGFMVGAFSEFILGRIVGLVPITMQFALQSLGGFFNDAAYGFMGRRLFHLEGDNGSALRNRDSRYSPLDNRRHENRRMWDQVKDDAVREIAEDKIAEDKIAEDIVDNRTDNRTTIKTHKDNHKGDYEDKHKNGNKD